MTATSNVIPFRKPPVVVLAYSAEDKSAPAERPDILGDVRANTMPNEWDLLIKRALFAAERAPTEIDRSIARSALHYIAHGPACKWPDCRALAARYLRRLDRPLDPKPAA